eukprot:EG_transcript_670
MSVVMRLCSDGLVPSSGMCMPFLCAGVALASEFWLATSRPIGGTWPRILHALEIPTVLLVAIQQVLEEVPTQDMKEEQEERTTYLHAVEMKLGQTWKALETLQCCLQFLFGSPKLRVTKDFQELLHCLDALCNDTIRRLDQPEAVIRAVFEHDAAVTLEACLDSALEVFLQKHRTLDRKVEVAFPDRDDAAMKAVIVWPFRLSVCVVDCLELSSNLVSPFHPLSVEIKARQERNALILNLRTNHKTTDHSLALELGRLQALLDRIGGVLLPNEVEGAVEFTLRFSLKATLSPEVAFTDCDWSLKVKSAMYAWYDGDETPVSPWEGSEDDDEEHPQPAIPSPGPISKEYSLIDAPFVTSPQSSPCKGPLQKFHLGIFRKRCDSPHSRQIFQSTPDLNRCRRVSPPSESQTERPPSNLRKSVDESNSSGCTAGTPDVGLLRRERSAPNLSSRGNRRLSAFSIQLRSAEPEDPTSGRTTGHSQNSSPNRSQPGTGRRDPRRMSVVTRTPNEDPVLSACSSFSSPMASPYERLGSYVFGRKSFHLQNEKQGPIRWRRGRLLGSGAFGHVYIGLDELAGEMFAVKVVQFDVNDPRIREKAAMLQTEIRMLQKLRHPNVVGYIGVQREANTMNIFQQYVAGGSVATLLSQFGAFNEDVTAVYTKQTTEGLAYLHENHVVHRDIKGGNVLVDIDGTVKLADFGSATTLNDLHGAKDLQGTPFWMAPEVLLGRDWTAQADIWSLGCTVMEMLTARRPFFHTEMTFVQLCTIVSETQEPVPLPPGISPKVASFLEYCFARDAQKRPTAEQLLCHPFLYDVQPAQGMDAVQEVLQWHNEWVQFLTENDRDGELANRFEEWTMQNHLRSQSEELRMDDTDEAPEMDFGPVVHSREASEITEGALADTTSESTASPQQSPQNCNRPRVYLTPPQSLQNSVSSHPSLPSAPLLSIHVSSRAASVVFEERLIGSGSGELTPKRKAPVIVPTSYLAYLETKHKQAVQSVNVLLQSAVKIQRAWLRHRRRRIEEELACIPTLAQPPLPRARKLEMEADPSPPAVVSNTTP